MKCEETSKGPLSFVPKMTLEGYRAQETFGFCVTTRTHSAGIETPSPDAYRSMFASAFFNTPSWNSLDSSLNPIFPMVDRCAHTSTIF